MPTCTHSLSREAFRRYLEANDLQVQDGYLLTPLGTKIGKAIDTGAAVLLVIFEEGYTQGNAHVTAWWPHFRPSYILVGGGDVEAGPSLAPDEVICDVCNAEVLIRPVPVVGGYAMCRDCFARTNLQFPGTVRPYIPVSLAWRDSAAAKMLEMYCDIHRPEEVYGLRCPGQASPDTRHHLEQNGLVNGTGWELTEDGLDLLGRVEAILSLEWHPEPPIPGTPTRLRPRAEAVADRNLSATHLGALHLLARRPGCTWMFLSKTFGAQPLRELRERGLARGEERCGAPWNLSAEGLTTLLEIAGAPTEESATEVCR